MTSTFTSEDLVEGNVTSVLVTFNYVDANNLTYIELKGGKLRSIKTALNSSLYFVHLCKPFIEVGHSWFKL